LAIVDDNAIFTDGRAVDVWVDLTRINLRAKLLRDEIKEVRPCPSQRESPVTMSIDVGAFVVYVEGNASFLETVSERAAGRAFVC
jgi:hypothetical protein